MIKIQSEDTRLSTHLDFIVIRHRKENLKKCSLRGLESNPAISFLSYPDDLTLLPKNFFSDTIFLSIDGDVIPENKSELPLHPILILDATWVYAEKMTKNIPGIEQAKRYILPQEWVTAYPRKQTGCIDPERGLASIEAMFIAALLFKKNPSGLLDNYYWKDLFFEKNKNEIEKLIF